MSPAKSMKCCRDGQMDHMQTNDMTACCKHCDMGKNRSVVRLHKGIQNESARINQFSLADFGSADSFCIAQRMNFEQCSAMPPFTAFSPPAFLIHQQFLI